jgi:hypothetical protein
MEAQVPTFFNFQDSVFALYFFLSLPFAFLRNNNHLHQDKLPLLLVFSIYTFKLPQKKSIFSFIPFVNIDLLTSHPPTCTISNRNKIYKNNPLEPFNDICM